MACERQAAVRGKGLLLLAWGVVVGWPAIGVMWEMLRGGAGDGKMLPPLHAPGMLLLTTLGWSFGVAIVSVVAAVPTAHLLASVGARSRAVLLAVLVLGLLLPSWAVYYAWWASAPPGSALYDFAASRGGVGPVRWFMLAVAMVAGTWPLVVCCVLPASMRWSRARCDQLAIDGAGFLGRQLARLRAERAGLRVGALLAALMTAGCTTAFDLAGVFTIANELRARAALGADVASLAATAWPMAIAAVLGGVVLWWWVARVGDDLAAAERPPRQGAAGAIFAAVVWLVLVAAPLVLLATLWWRIDDSAGPAAPSIGEPMLRTLARAGGVGLLVAVLVAGTRKCWGARWCRVLGMSWVAAALLPAPMVAAAVGAVWSGSISSSGAAWVLGLLVRGGAVALLASRWLAASESRQQRDLQTLDPTPWWRPDPTTAATAAAAGMIAVAFAVSDIALAARLSPPMSHPPLAVTLLNAMHYQRPETIVRVLAWLPLPVLAAGVVIALSLLRPRRGAAHLWLLCLMIPMACERAEDIQSSLPPVPASQTVGLPGRAPGRFEVPRGIASDGRGGIYVVDKSARVQRLDAAGDVSVWWTMPAFDNGKPTGLSVTPQGEVAVADTHEYRVSVFSSEGELQRTFGDYGTDPGHFIYPTDVLIDARGAWYVSEYGGNDRIQVFDQAGAPIRVLGGPGEAPGQYRRPQSMAFSPGGEVLWVADSCNHRVQGIDPLTGEQVWEIGSGWLRYPYGVATLPDGSLIVTEFGGHRLSRWSPSGERLGAWGGWGRGPGRLRMPWGVSYDPSSDLVQVLDTGNARVLRIPRAALTSDPER